MDLPLGKAKCIHCLQVASEDEVYSVGGHGPVCESCTNESKLGFTITGDLPKIKKLFNSYTPARKG